MKRFSLILHELLSSIRCLFSFAVENWRRNRVALTHFSNSRRIHRQRIQTLLFPGSAWEQAALEALPPRVAGIYDGSAGRACNTLGSQAEPGNQLRAISKKCQELEDIHQPKSTLTHISKTELS
jgi:hypothetical protein